jgi:hypothetical protein
MNAHEKNRFRPKVQCLEGREVPSTSPLTAPLEPHALATAAAAPALHVELDAAHHVAKITPAQRLTTYLVGTWANTIGNPYGLNFQVRQVWYKNGTYRTYLNYVLDAQDIPHMVPFYQVDRGTWKVATANTRGTLNGSLVIHSVHGNADMVYITSNGPRLADVGVLPVNANPGTQPIWMHYAKLL